jgi:hypothetical protein
MNSLEKTLFYKPGIKAIHVISAVLSFALYAVIILYFKVDKPDLILHIGISNRTIAKGDFPVHPIFFGLIQVLSLFSLKYSLQLFAGFLIFSVAQYFKIVLSLKILKEYFKMEYTILLFIAVLALQVVIPIPFFSKFFMVNSLSMNYFHNGTLNCSIPFCLGLILNMMRFIKTDERKYFNYSLGLGILICLTKPSFLFCFAPIFPFVILYKNGLNQALLRTVQLSILLVFFIIGQSVYLHSTTATAASFEVKFQPFYLFGTLPNHGRVLFEGFFIGLLVIAFFFKSILKDTFFLASLLFVLLGYFISFCFVDYTNGETSPNFVWQSCIVNYVFVLLSFGYFMPKQSLKEFTWKGVICFTALAAHGICGLLYLKDACLFRIFYLSM